MKTEADFWACRVCRSINPIRSDRCYSCHTPREVAAAKPTELSLTSTEAPKLEPVGTFRSSEPRAVAVTLAAAAFIVATLVSLWLAWQAGEALADGVVDDASRLLGERLPFFLAAVALGISALVAYGAWISRVVANLPLMGLGYSRVSPTFAFVEPLIPGVNIVSLPARIGEVVRKLEGTAVDLALIVAAWGLLIGPPVLAALLLRFGGLIQGESDFLRTVGLTLLVVFVLQAVGLVIGLVLVWRVEHLVRGRAGAVAPAAPAASSQGA